MIPLTKNIDEILISTAKWTPWNPTTGCSKVSEACKNCYAETTSLFLQRRKVDSYANGFLPVFHESRINTPDHFRKPRRIFVNAMSDVFHEAFTDAEITKVLETIYRSPQHIYFILTKRPERMLTFMETLPAHPRICIGVTVEHEQYCERADYLLDLQERFVTFVNCEPLLGPISGLPKRGIDICFAAPETGAKRRPSFPEWFTSLEHYCKSNNIIYIGHRFDIRSDAGIRPISP